MIMDACINYHSEFYQAPVQIKRMGQRTRRWLPVILNGPASLRAAPPLLSDLERGNFVIPFRCGTVTISRGLFQMTASYCVIYFLTALTSGIVYWGGGSLLTTLPDHKPEGCLLGSLSCPPTSGVWHLLSSVGVPSDRTECSLAPRVTMGTEEV